MWIQRALTLLMLLSGIALAYFMLDILAWTFGWEWFNPLRALVGLGVWCVPFFLLLFTFLTPAQRMAILSRKKKKK